MLALLASASVATLADEYKELVCESQQDRKFSVLIIDSSCGLYSPCCLLDTGNT